MTTGFDFSRFPTLRGDHTILRELEPADAADVFAFRSDAEVQRYNSEPMQDVVEAAALIDKLREECMGHRAFHWAITHRESPRVIGLAGLVSWEPYHRRAEIGYDLRRDRWGQGLATDAVRAMLKFAFTELDLNRAEAQTIADNHQSVKLLQRLGFRWEGVRRAYSWEEDGNFHDGAIYGLLRHEHQ